MHSLTQSKSLLLLKIFHRVSRESMGELGGIFKRAEPVSSNCIYHWIRGSRLVTRKKSLDSSTRHIFLVMPGYTERNYRCEDRKKSWRVKRRWVILLISHAVIFNSFLVFCFAPFVPSHVSKKKRYAQVV
jgi:hypothetical protein